MNLSRLKLMREERKLSAEELGKLAGVSHVTIYNIEKGKGTILNNAKAIAKALKVKLEELV